AAVPCTKLTGKWLFPRAALERWAGGRSAHAHARPRADAAKHSSTGSSRPRARRRSRITRSTGGKCSSPMPMRRGVMLAPLAAAPRGPGTIPGPAVAPEPALLHAAGSLRTALTEVAAAFEAASAQRVRAKYGPSGTLKDEILGGAHAEVFASANMEHPQALATA